MREATHLLVAREYDALERICAGVRFPAADLAQAVADYGETLFRPPANEASNVVTLTDGIGWSVVVDLYNQAGRSDLSLELTIVQVGDDLAFSEKPAAA